jgi:cytochrome c5
MNTPAHARFRYHLRGRWWVAGCILLSACGAALPRVTPAFTVQAQQHDATVTEARLQSGRDLYVSRCSSCHSLVDPTAYSEAEWPSWIHRMAGKAHIAPSQEALIFTYLKAARNTPESP